MKKGVRNFRLLLLCCFLIFGTVFLSACLKVDNPFLPYKERSFKVWPQTTSHYDLELKEGNYFEGVVIVRGKNDDLRFYLKDPTGQVIEEVEVKREYRFKGTAKRSGFYTFYFDNHRSLVTSKEVLLRYGVR
jgi:hypothetical protein